LAFFNLLLPLAIYLFIDYLYEKKRKYALAQHSPLGVALTTILVVMMTGLIMLVSNVFQFGAYVIATESMTGELNKGDIAVYERYDDGEIVEVGDVIVFKEQNKHVVHRVVDKSNINGETRYYTKGDANSEMDLGYITDGDIKGVVVLKLPYFGYPTLWLRDLFK
jgi:signal peptidase I